MRRRKKSLRVRPRGLAGTTGTRRDEECYRRALEACRARLCYASHAEAWLRCPFWALEVGQKSWAKAARIR